MPKIRGSLKDYTQLLQSGSQDGEMAMYLLDQNKRR